MNDVRFQPMNKAGDIAAGPAPTPDPGFLEILSEFLAYFWRKRLVIAVCVVAGVGLAAYVAFTTPAVYQARTLAVFEVESPDLLDETRGVATGPSSTVLATEMLILASYSLLAEVVERLDLDEDPEFNLYLRDEDDPAVRSISGLVRDALGLSADDVARAAPTDKDIAQHVIRTLAANVRVSAVGSSYAYTVTVEAGDARKAALIANTIVKTHIDDIANRRMAAAERAAADADKRLESLKASLREAEQEVAMRRATAPSGLELHLADIDRQVAALYDSLAVIEARAEDAGQRLDRMRVARAADDANVVYDASDADWLGARRREIVLARTALLRADTPETRAAFDRAAEGVERELASTLDDAAARGAALRANIEALRRDYDAQSAAVLEMREHERRASALRVAYETLLTRVRQRMSGPSGADGPEARVISEALPPANPSSPRTQLLLALGLIGGGVIGGGLAVFLNVLPPKIHTPAALARIAGNLPIVEIPRTARPVAEGALTSGRGKAAARYVLAMRRLAAALCLRYGTENVFLVTSPRCEWGVGASAAGLALVMTQAGYRTLLLRCGATTPEDPGLAAMMDGAVDWRKAVRIQGDGGLARIDAPPPRDAAADLFGRAAFLAMMTEMRKAYQVVVIDAPDCLGVLDAQFLAREATAVLLVVRANGTRSADVRESVARLAGAAPVETVFSAA